MERWAGLDLITAPGPAASLSPPFSAASAPPWCTWPVLPPSCHSALPGVQVSPPTRVAELKPPYPVSTLKIESNPHLSLPAPSTVPDPGWGGSIHKYHKLMNGTFFFFQKPALGEPQGVRQRTSLVKIMGTGVGQTWRDRVHGPTLGKMWARSQPTLHLGFLLCNMGVHAAPEAGVRTQGGATVYSSL